MDYCLHETEATADASGTRLFDAERSCALFAQRVLRVDGDDAGERLDPAADEVLYVRAGSAELELGDERTELHPGAALYVRNGTPWRIRRAAGLELLSVLVHDPLPGETEHAVLDVAERDAGGATAGRQFRLLATPEVGCATVTQFVGYIPVGRAPDHYHHYDEVVFVLQGNGALHIGGETAPLEAGSAVHLPAKLVHCLENVGPGEMQVLGVFRPAGSPAEAYYPDGTLATVPADA